MTKCLLHMSRIFMIMFSLVFFTNSKRQTSSPTWQPKRVVFQALRYVTRHGEHLIRTAFETCYGLLGGDNHQSCLFGRVFWERVSRMTSFDGKVDKNPCVCCWSIFADVIFFVMIFYLLKLPCCYCVRRCIIKNSMSQLGTCFTLILWQKLNQ